MTLVQQPTTVGAGVVPRRRLRKIKLTYVIGSLRDGGTELQVLELIRNIDRDRFDVSLILFEDTNTERIQDLVEHYFVLGIPQAGNSRWILRGPALAKATYRSRQYLRRCGTDVVHAFLPGPCILAGLAARFASIPLVIGSRRSLPSQYRSRKRIGAWADGMALGFAHFNLGNSCAVTSEMIELCKCPPEKCGTIYNGVDLRRFNPDRQSNVRQQLGWTRGEIVFGMVANFRPCKRHCDFVEAAALVLDRNPGARFLMVGADCGTKGAVLQQIQALSLGDKIRVLDSTSSPETIFPALDVYVSTSEAEGFSNVLLEAMACGKPVIATRVGGNPEAVRDMESGILVTAHQPQEIAKAAVRLISSPSLRREMGKAARTIVEQRFSIEAMVRAHENLYHRLFNASSRASDSFSSAT